MDSFFKKGLPSLFIIFITALLTFLILQISVPQAQPELKKVADVKNKTHQNQILYLTAVGDSLTQGVGDETNSGGYVPLLSDKLEEEFGFKKVSAENFGKSGDRSDQILKRINKSKDVQKKISEADIITLTVGGNDLMKVIRSEIMNDLSIESFEKPKKEYQSNLKKLYQELRKLNPKAPIYQLGIYNPFYLNFPELTEMQTVVDMWNAVSEATVREEENSFFIPINDQLYKGVDGVVGIGDGSAAEESPNSNNLLSELDSFHPNFLGYQIIASNLNEKIVATQQNWLKK